MNDEESLQDKFRGSLLGGAIGDALGYAVEFKSISSIMHEFGEEGIREYRIDKCSGKALISDDTQMTLYTANGILHGITRGALRGIMTNIEYYIHLSYLDWLETQHTQKSDRYIISWLNTVEELHNKRAPGRTCLSALESGKMGTIDNPINSSKGCGGIMRVAPIGLYFNRNGKDVERIAMIGAQAAAITHGHSLGYMPAAALVIIINRLLYGTDAELLDIVNECKRLLRELFAKDLHLAELIRIIDLAIELSGNNEMDYANISRLGEGWVAEETLAIALYCCLKYQNIFTEGLIASVNHDGDSDSTGSVTGNILGAIHGLKAIPDIWKRNLELFDVIIEISDDLFNDCKMIEYGEYHDDEWLRKYVYRGIDKP